MKEIHTAIEIAAPGKRVWQILTDFPAFPEWNPFILGIEGEARAGSRLVVRFRGVTFRPRVLRAEASRELRWLGHLFFRGLLDGEHFFIIEEIAESRVRLVHGERFNGLLVPLLSRRLHRDTAGDFENMNRALKARAEASAN